MAVNNASNGKRITFIGSETMGWECLNELFKLEENIVGVFTTPPTEAQNIISYKSFDNYQSKVPLVYTSDINSDSVIKAIKAQQPDVIYQVGWSQLLSKELLQIPHKGCVGFHGTLLPKHRGRAPIPWSIIFGLRKNGMTLMYLSEGADLGDIIGQESYEIKPEDSATEIYEKSTQACKILISRYHNLIMEGTAPREKIDISRSDYWPRRVPQDGIIDWNKDSNSLDSWIRALTHPFPGAFTYWQNKKLFIWKAFKNENTNLKEPGKIVSLTDQGTILVQTGSGILELYNIQLEGENEVTTKKFLENHSINENDLLG